MPKNQLLRSKSTYTPALSTENCASLTDALNELNERRQSPWARRLSPVKTDSLAFNRESARYQPKPCESAVDANKPTLRLTRRGQPDGGNSTIGSQMMTSRHDDGSKGHAQRTSRLTLKLQKSQRGTGQNSTRQRADRRNSTKAGHRPTKTRPAGLGQRSKVSPMKKGQLFSKHVATTRHAHAKKPN